MNIIIRTHNGKEIVPDGDRIKVVSLPDGTHALLIDKATPADAGKYGVVAINDKGESASTADLTVASEYFSNKLYNYHFILTGPLKNAISL